jgi:formylglycine-generating enzyme required for sulfatase activity
MKMRRFIANLLLATMPLTSGGCHCEQRSGQSFKANALNAARDSRSQTRLHASFPPWTNSLGMRFLPVEGTEVLFAVWDTRVQDYAAFVKATGRKPSPGMWSLRNQRYGQHGDTWDNPGFVQGPTHPVCGVNWNDTQAFCSWLTEKEHAEGIIEAHQSYRLPTDWEWSTAAGLADPPAGRPRDKDEKPINAYGWGATWPPPSTAGNYAGTDTTDADWPRNWKVIENRRDEFARTSPVGTFPPNKSGLYDMGGNVWQWCQDDYDDIRGTKPLRGGSWADVVPRFLSLSFRLDFAPEDRFDYATGFRVVLTGKRAPASRPPHP